MKYFISGLLFTGLIIYRHAHGEDATAALVWFILAMLWLIFVISDAGETIADAIDRHGNKVTDRLDDE